MENITVVENEAVIEETTAISDEIRQKIIGKITKKYIPNLLAIIDETGERTIDKGWLIYRYRMLHDFLKRQATNKEEDSDPVWRILQGICKVHGVVFKIIADMNENEKMEYEANKRTAKGERIRNTRGRIKSGDEDPRGKYKKIAEHGRKITDDNILILEEKEIPDIIAQCEKEGRNLIDDTWLYNNARNIHSMLKNGDRSEEIRKILINRLEMAYIKYGQTLLDKVKTKVLELIETSKTEGRTTISKTMLRRKMQRLIEEVNQSKEKVSTWQEIRKLIKDAGMEFCEYPTKPKKENKKEASKPRIVHSKKRFDFSEIKYLIAEQIRYNSPILPRLIIIKVNNFLQANRLKPITFSEDNFKKVKLISQTSEQEFEAALIAWAQGTQPITP